MVLKICQGKLRALPDDAKDSDLIYIITKEELKLFIQKT